jgi:hypothetical protein
MSFFWFLAFVIFTVGLVVLAAYVYRGSWTRAVWEKEQREKEREAYSYRREYTRPEFKPKKHPVIAWVIVGAVVTMWLLMSVTSVPANTYSVRTAFGAPVDVVDNGLHLVPPYTSGSEFSSSKQWIIFKGNGDPEHNIEHCINVRLARQATACVDGIFTYNQPAEHVKELFSEYRNETNVRKNLAERKLQQSLGTALAEYDPLGQVQQDKDALVEFSGRTQSLLNAMVNNKLANVELTLTFFDYDEDTDKRIAGLSDAFIATRNATQAVETSKQLALANQIIADSLKGDPNTAFFRCVQMFTELFREIKPQQVNLTAICANSIGAVAPR